MTAAVGGDRLLQLIDDAQGDRGGGVRADQVRSQDRKLVAPEAGHQVVLAHRGLQPVSDLDQHLVAGRVTVHVVDPLEAVQIQQQQTMRAVGPRRRAQGRLQGLLELAAIGQAGQRVLERQPVRFVLRRPALGVLAAMTQEIAGEHHQAAGKHGGDR